LYPVLSLGVIVISAEGASNASGLIGQVLLANADALCAAAAPLVETEDVNL